MIIKMKFLSISGPRTDIDRVSASYLSKYEMQLENAFRQSSAIFEAPAPLRLSLIHI